MAILYISFAGCPSDNKYNNPPYTPGIIAESLQDKTLCPSYQQHIGSHYDLHNLYGYHEAKVTNG